MRVCVLLCVFLLFFSSSCKKITMEDKSPDIKKLNTSFGIKIDFRIFRKTYGEPPIFDEKTQSYGYFNIYCEHAGLFSFHLKPNGSEVWYLILKPTKDENYYSGIRYRDCFPVYSELGKKMDFNHGKPLLIISEIEKLSQVGKFEKNIENIIPQEKP